MDWSRSALSITLYGVGSTVPVADPAGVLTRVQDIRFSSGYPGGLFLTASFVIPIDVTHSIPIQHAQRCVIRNGPAVVWEGFITEIAYNVGTDIQSIEVSAMGYYSLLASRYKYDRVIDRRFIAPQVNVWAPLDDGSNVNNKCTFDSNNRLMFVPRFEAWGNGEHAALRYTTNGGSNIKRAQFTYDMQEGAQQWELRLQDITNNASLFLTGSSGSGTQDITFGTSTPELEFQFYSRAAQTPTSSSIYGKITSLAVFGENASGLLSTTPSQIVTAYAKYASSPFSSLSTCIDQTNTYDLIPIGIVSDDLTESIQQFMMRIAQFSSDNSKWSVGVRESDVIAGGASPVIYYEKQPILTDYDYVISLDEENMVGEFKFVTSSLMDELANNAYVQYTNARGQKDWTYTPVDTTSKNKYMQRIVSIDAGVSASAGADTYGLTYLTSRSGLQYYVSGPITVKGYLRHKAGDRVPAPNVRAGERIKIENFIGDFGDTVGTGFTFLISQTEYDDRAETVSLTLGRPDNLAVNLASMEKSVVMNKP